MYSEDDEDDPLSSSQSFHSTPTPPPPAVRSRGDTGRMGGVQVLPPMSDGPPVPPRHSQPQLSFSSSGSTSGNVGRALPPVPQQQPQMPPVPSPQPKQLPQPVTRARPPSMVGAPYGRSDSNQFGPGKQEKEVRKGDVDLIKTVHELYLHTKSFLKKACIYFSAMTTYVC